MIRLRTCNNASTSHYNHHGPLRSGPSRRNTNVTTVYISGFTHGCIYFRTHNNVQMDTKIKGRLSIWRTNYQILFQANGLQIRTFVAIRWWRRACSRYKDIRRVRTCLPVCHVIRNSSAVTIYPFIFWDLPCQDEVSTRLNHLKSSDRPPTPIHLLSTYWDENERTSWSQLESWLHCCVDSE